MPEISKGVAKEGKGLFPLAPAFFLSYIEKKRRKGLAFGLQPDRLNNYKPNRHAPPGAWRLHKAGRDTTIRSGRSIRSALPSSPRGFYLEAESSSF